MLMQSPIKSEPLKSGASARVGRFPISASIISGIAVAIDSFAILGTGALLYFLQIEPKNADTLSLYSAATCSVWVTTLLLYQFSELYRFEFILRPFANLDKAVLSFGTGLLLLMAAAFALKISDSYSRTWVGIFGGLAFAFTFFGRLGLAVVVRQLARRGVFCRSVIVAGTKTHVKRVLERLAPLSRAPGGAFVSISGIFIAGPAPASIGDHAVLGSLDDIPAFVRSFRVDDVVIAMPWAAERRIVALVGQLRELPVNVYLGSDLIGLRLNFRDPPGHFNGAPIFTVIGHPMSGWAVAIKAIEDYALAILFLAIAAIPMAAIALLIRLDSPGPVFFRQKRFGFNNKVFWIYKFRTMRHSTVPEDKTVQAVAGDTRVTKIGRFLRRSSLDELPQLFNVLNGTMSLVGPRPHAVDHNEEYASKIRGYFARHRVKPGITGWAQVNGLRGETDTPEKMEARVRHDIFYADNWSPFLDLRIIIQTVFVIVWGRNAH